MHWIIFQTMRRGQKMDSKAFDTEENFLRYPKKDIFLLYRKKSLACGQVQKVVRV